MSSHGDMYDEFGTLEFVDLEQCVSKAQHQSKQTCKQRCKQERELSAALRKLFSLSRRKSFAAFVASKQTTDGEHWCCCGQSFSEHSTIHQHVARSHHREVQQGALSDFNKIQAAKPRTEPEPESTDLESTDLESTDLESTDLESTHLESTHLESTHLETTHLSSWSPDTSHLTKEQLTCGPGRVLLYYCYTDVADPPSICAWQKELCERLHLTGKVRVAFEGINGTVGGSCVSTEVYIQAMSSCPVFNMSRDDFKISNGGADCFPELKVGVYREIVPMGVDPREVSFHLAGTPLEPEEFHREVETFLLEGERRHDTVLLDCRNFYESRIGHFTHCLAPNIRKFSYFPDYVDQNLDLFRNKRVLMYCTGGIRCERASAYLRTKGVCQEVLQLRGGVHKYLEQFPEGHYRGKLFVFDERFSICSNDDVISDCRYCGAPWDQYKLCSSAPCRQLVLSCPGCRGRGLTACCPTCQAKGRGAVSADSAPAANLSPKEACECTSARPRIPLGV